MVDFKSIWKKQVLSALTELSQKNGGSPIDLGIESVITEYPPKPEMGDIGFPMFSYAKFLKKNPSSVANDVASIVNSISSHEAKGEARAVGPYLNIFLDRNSVICDVLDRHTDGAWQHIMPMSGKRIMVEFSCPNTNKPLHLGHLRNNALGESLSRVLQVAGAEVRKVNLINDRGIHICKSMLAYQVYGEGRTPEDEGLKSDHFVGKYYVMFNQLKNEDPQAEVKAQNMLRDWEAGNRAVLDLWKRMNDWAVEGIKTTYIRQGISFDSYYFESLTYTKGVSEVLQGLKKGFFYKKEDGSIWVNLEDIGLDTKVLLRSDGTSLYVTQDIGTAIYRHDDWPFERLVYVVASEQQYHFRVLFEILKRLGHEWAKNLYHLAYGLVNLPSGRMKTREGTVVDADDLMDELADLARKEISAKGRDESVGDVSEVAEKVALGALHYYLLQTSPTKDMLYDPEQSLAFNGNTGPYIQYMGARACSILRKWELTDHEGCDTEIDHGALTGSDDWILVRTLAAFDNALELASRTMEPSAIAAYAHEVAATFSSWYRDNPVINAPDPNLRVARVALVRSVRSTLKLLCHMLCIPFLEVM